MKRARRAHSPDRRRPRLPPPLCLLPKRSSLLHPQEHTCLTHALAGAGQLLMAAADARGLHRPILLLSFLATVVCRAAMALTPAFGSHVLLVLGLH